MPTLSYDSINNSVASVRKQTIPTERPPLVGEDSATLSAQRIPRPHSRRSRPEPLLFFQVAPQLYSWTPFQTHYFSENLVAPGIEPGPLDL
jgi:hypothetical protein